MRLLCTTSLNQTLFLFLFSLLLSPSFLFQQPSHPSTPSPITHFLFLFFVHLAHKTLRNCQKAETKDLEISEIRYLHSVVRTRYLIINYFYTPSSIPSNQNSQSAFANIKSEVKTQSGPVRR
ncbi:uncharacterized protein LY89DRAFT_683504 [Mollisia scopiformis]|uniref:Uncharacterized protein n=1 Tax=Mollisia scopiformis TaxID=149040 RepID=A0A194XFK9_MOLSC|nr:uncharacterized protein LY89DRAFT_683504 [Mollisia scopiformis]KUJ18557.1 hypothetical protein LY89DRAFT_683504 [Mollisia scopiformis]